MSTEVYVTKLPTCDVCASEGAPGTEAHYDGATVMGPWANMCEDHFQSLGRGLGTGRGQKLIVGEKPVIDKGKAINEAIANGASFDEIEDLVGDGDLAEYL